VKRHLLSKRDMKELINAVPELSDYLRGLSELEYYGLEDLTLYVAEKMPILAVTELIIEGVKREYRFPTIPFINRNPQLQDRYGLIDVDQGAVSHVAGGADVMRPGIKTISGNFSKGSIVLVRDPRGLVIAVGVALYSSGDMIGMSKGKVIQNIHHVNDRIWRIFEELNKD